MTSCLQCGHADPGGFVYCPRCGNKAVEAEPHKDPLLGRTLNGKYRIETEIGLGAMGTVYLGEHVGLKKKVALKVLHKDLQVSEETLQRFQREGIAAGKFNHPHAIQIFDFDRAEGGVFYLAMEYVEGWNLGLFLRQRGRLQVELAVRLARQMISCLAEAHRHGIVHRDFKPENIMVSESSRGELRVKVLDFGLSKLVDRRLGSSLVTEPGRLLGTPLYMAPEQAAGEEADARSDVYAAGLILYEMLAGKRPFREGSAAQFFLTRATAEAPSLAADLPELGIPDELDQLLLRALQREREQRFQSAEELLLALDEVPVAAAASHARSQGASTLGPRLVPRPAAAAGAPPAAAPATAGTRAGPRRVAVALGVLALLGGLAWWASRLLDGGATSAHAARVRLVPEAQRSELERRYLGLLDDARMKLLGGDAEGAVTAVEQATLLECRDAEAGLVKAEIYRGHGDVDMALATYRAASLADPAFVEPLLGMSWIALEQGDLPAAEESLARAAELAPEAAEVEAARGALAWKRGQVEEARTLLEHAAARDPACGQAQLYLGRLALDRGQVDAALAALLEARRQDSRSVRPLAWLAEAYLARGEPDKADLQLEEALRLEPGSAELRVERGALMLELGHGAEALAFLRESTERVPREGRLWILRGIAARDAGDQDGAIAALERAFEQGAHDPEARCLLGALYQRQKRLPEAIAQYEDVLKEVGDYPLANLDLGLVLLSQEKYAEAAQRLERSLAFDEGNAAAHLHLGRLYKDFLGDPTRAREHLERYRALGGDDARVPGWLAELR